MGFHNDRRTNGKMPTNDSAGVIIKELFIVAMALSELFLILLSVIMLLKLLPSRISWPLVALFLGGVSKCVILMM